MINNHEAPGLPRAYFYARFVSAAREVLARDPLQETPTTMVDKVNIQEALDRLLKCPVCGGPLETNPSHPQFRMCSAECGDFSVTDVWMDGDVTFEFRMIAPANKTQHRPSS